MTGPVREDGDVLWWSGDPGWVWLDSSAPALLRVDAGPTDPVPLTGTVVAVGAFEGKGRLFTMSVHPEGYRRAPVDTHEAEVPMPFEHAPGHLWFTGDVDGDDADELLEWSSDLGAVRVHDLQRDTWRTGPWFATGLRTNEPVVMDEDRDGHADVLWVRRDERAHALVVLRGSPSGLRGPVLDPTPLPIGGCRAGGPRLSDLLAPAP